MLCNSSIYAQQNYRCATDEVMAARAAENPNYEQAVQAAFDYAKQKAAEQASLRQMTEEILRIPVVVHIVYQNSEENLSNAVIQSQIDVLNQDFRRQNPDAFEVRPYFEPCAGDVGIEFYLATEDPNGNATTGVTRTQGNPGFFGFNPLSDNIKSTSSGGKDGWNSDKYLNIWTGRLGLGVLGYAYPPEGAPNWPSGSFETFEKAGVVVDYRAFGVDNPAATSQFLSAISEGRTATHEVGHYLGLRHIWGDGACGEDDGISDTPKASAASSGCSTSQNTCADSYIPCTGENIDYPDMIENFMDYSSCSRMFTLEQIGVMRAVLLNLRSGLLGTTCEAPINLSESNSTANGITLNWDAVAGATEYQVAGRVQGGNWKVFPVQTANFKTFTNGLQAGTTYEWTVRAKCGAWTDWRQPVRSFTAGSGKNANLTTSNTLNIYPNPFSERANISFEVATAGNTSVEIYGLNGSHITTIFDGKTEANMPYTIDFEANTLENGMYIAKMTMADGKVKFEKMVLNR